MRDAHDVPESPSAAPVSHVDVAGDDVAERAFHRALGVVVGEGRHGLEFFGAQLYADRMLLADSEPQGLGEPVGILAFQGLFQPFVVQGLPGGGLEGIIRRIIAFAVFHVQFLQGVAEVVTRQVRRLDSNAAIIGDAALVVGEGLGLDDDDAVGALRSVDGLGRGVLEDGDALDPVHVHVGHFFQGGLEAV